MGLSNNKNSQITYVNIKKGVLVVKQKDKTYLNFTDLTGTVYDVKYIIDNYNNNEFELAQIFLNDGKGNFCLQMKTDSGYFRSFCNSIKSGDITKPMTIVPKFDDKNGKNKTIIFVYQNKKALKHFHTLNNMGDLPPVLKVTFKGKESWDGTEQLEYFKNWLMSAVNKSVPEITDTNDSDNIDDINNEEISDEVPF
jgi:hypothetical protein